MDERPQEARGVRLISKKINFGDDDETRSNFQDDGIYGSAEDMQDKWGLSDKQATVKHKGRRRVVAFLIALGIFFLFIAGIFFVLMSFKFKKEELVKMKQVKSNKKLKVDKK